MLLLGLFFVLAGIAIAITDGLQGTVLATILPSNVRGTGYGTLALLNSIGNFASSALVGFLWIAVSPLVGFGYSALTTILGGLLLLFIRGNVEEQAK